MCQCATCSFRSRCTSSPSAPLVHDLVDLLVEGRVAEHVADLEQPAGALGRLHDAHALGRGRRDRLLEQHVVAPLDRGQRRLDVQRVAGRDDRDLGQARRRVEALAPVAVDAAAAGISCSVATAVRARVVGLGDGDDAQRSGIRARPARVHEAASIARPRSAPRAAPLIALPRRYTRRP